MIKKELIRQLTEHKGPVFVRVFSLDEVFWVKAVKSDLIAQCVRIFPDGETGFKLVDGSLEVEE